MNFPQNEFAVKDNIKFMKIIKNLFFSSFHTKQLVWYGFKSQRFGLFINKSWTQISFKITYPEIEFKKIHFRGKLTVAAMIYTYL